ncbi:MAG: hypothetical protein ACLRX5_10350 [Slackia sp.]
MKSKTARLEELCTIKTEPRLAGRKISEGIDPKEVKVLLPRAMQAGTIVDEDLAVEVVGEVKDENFTHEGDVVIKLSTPYDSVYVDKAHEGIMIASFGMVLRKKPEAELNMQYLSMFLNLPQTNSVLQAVSTGQSAAMAMLNARRWPISKSRCSRLGASESSQPSSRPCGNASTSTYDSSNSMRNSSPAK